MDTPKNLVNITEFHINLWQTFIYNLTWHCLYIWGSSFIYHIFTTAGDWAKIDLFNLWLVFTWKLLAGKASVDVFEGPIFIDFKRCVFSQKVLFYIIYSFLFAFKGQNWIFLFILKVANIRGFILIKCSEQEARFKKYVKMSKLVKRIWMSVCGIAINTPNYKSAAFPKFSEHW